MFSMKGQVINTFTVAPSEKYPQEAYKVQFMGDQLTRDGQVKKELVTMGIPQEAFVKLEKLIGQVVSIPIGLFVTNGQRVRKGNLKSWNWRCRLNNRAPGIARLPLPAQPVGVGGGRRRA